MAIRDLLWACPVCGTDSGLVAAGRSEACRACRTSYRRGGGATIVATGPDGSRTVRSVTAWLERMPPLALPLEGDSSAPYRRDRVEVRFAEDEHTVRAHGRFLGRIERLGPSRPGVLTLEADRLVFVDDDGDQRVWLFTALTAVQGSSSTLQIKACGERVVSFRFPQASIRLWEVLFESALRRLYQAAGRGDIIEFQPRIVTR